MRYILAALLLAPTISISATRVFYDGSESGNTNLWSQVDYRNKCTSVTAPLDGGAGPYSGSRMIRCNWDGVAAWNSAESYEALSLTWNYTNEFLIRLWVRSDSDVDAKFGSKWLRLYNQGVNSFIMDGQMEQAGGPIYSNIESVDGSNTNYNNWGSALLGNQSWHKAEIYVKHGVSNDAIFRVWVDGNLQHQRTGFSSNPANKWYPLIFVSNWSNNGPTWEHDNNNHTYWDEIEIFSDSTGGTAATGSMSDATVTVGGGGGDTTPPVISSPLPTGTQPYGTTSVTLQVTTNENATCRYSATDVAYASMASTFGSTGGTTHQQTGFAVSNGQNYTRYVRCIDSFGNANTSSSTISFSVSAVNETILDNDGAGSSQSGSWLQSTYVAGYYGANYHYAPEAVGHWFQWTTSISPGTYVVYARWPAIVGRPTNAQYEITNSSGTATVGANQTENGNQWNMLGTYTFGSTATVRLLSSASGPEGAAADAVRFLAAAGDVTAPSTTISTSDPSTIYSDSLSVTGTASDAVGVIGCKWRIGSAPNASNGTACTGTTSFSCSTSGYSIGSNALHVGCYDAAGNYGTDSITVSYPCKKLATPSGLSFVGLVANPPSNATLSFDWSDVTTHADGSALTGDLANYRTYFGTVSGGPYNTASSASSQISVGPTNANVTYYARVAAESSVNSICNSDQTAEISLFADTVPPVLSGLNPSGNYPKTAANVALGVTTNEAATCRHGSAGSAWSSKTAFSTTGATSHSATLAVWAGLVKRICYQCRDAMLNESAESCTTFSVSAKQKAGGFN